MNIVLAVIAEIRKRLGWYRLPDRCKLQRNECGMWRFVDPKIRNGSECLTRAGAIADAWWHERNDSHNALRKHWTDVEPAHEAKGRQGDNSAPSTESEA